MTYQELSKQYKSLLAEYAADKNEEVYSRLIELAKQLRELDKRVGTIHRPVGGYEPNKSDQQLIVWYE